MSVDVSIIIPVLNDAAMLARCLESLKAFANGPVSYEVIVVDGGSTDESVRVAREFGIEALITERGRAKQMNAGAARATGKWLWFLHADCVPHADSLEAIKQADALWGCFIHQISPSSFLLEYVEAGDYLRSRVLGIPYGDQGIFVRKEVFVEVGGYPDEPILEEVLLALKLRKRKWPVVLPRTLKSDARRWQRRGVIGVTRANWTVMYRYFIRRRPLDEAAEYYRQQQALPHSEQFHLISFIAACLAAAVLLGIRLNAPDPVVPDHLPGVAVHVKLSRTILIAVDIICVAAVALFLAEWFLRWRRDKKRGTTS
ncbi:MAG TPA: TIGR04283 family arsenosugar biosynthesis glycosyltransferase [Planctomycetota bacterium]|nr:TIGR04283 family arsenosugar biosynthesis glycosyltransferase [Planctomycetota bacterium]